MTQRFATLDQLHESLDSILASPRREGRVEAITACPSTNVRNSMEEARLSPEGGLEGDRWQKTCWRKLPDGRSDPKVQLTLINSRLLSLIAGSRDRWSLSGDNLAVDMNLTEENLPVGTRFRIGEALVEVSELPHTGCKKFASRFGADALKFISKPDSKGLRLRGCYVFVVEAGQIRIGDPIRKL